MREKGKRGKRQRIKDEKTEKGKRWKREREKDRKK